ncbi:hypothetical protein N7453_008585 [Penicillium expansum]|nr:hypothetical protein N7453_008585 [Penicillium expansum]
MSTATILGAFPNENMRSVPDDAMFDISTYPEARVLGRRFHNSSYEMTGGRHFAAHGLQITAKSLKVKANSQKTS